MMTVVPKKHALAVLKNVVVNEVWHLNYGILNYGILNYDISDIDIIVILLHFFVHNALVKVHYFDVNNHFYASNLHA